MCCVSQHHIKNKRSIIPSPKKTTMCSVTKYNPPIGQGYIMQIMLTKDMVLNMRTYANTSIIYTYNETTGANVPTPCDTRTNIVPYKQSDNFTCCSDDKVYIGSTFMFSVIIQHDTPKYNIKWIDDSLADPTKMLYALCIDNEEEYHIFKHDKKDIKPSGCCLPIDYNVSHITCIMHTESMDGTIWHIKQQNKSIVYCTPIIAYQHTCDIRFLRANLSIPSGIIIHDVTGSVYCISGVNGPLRCTPIQLPVKIAMCTGMNTHGQWMAISTDGRILITMKDNDSTPFKPSITTLRVPVPIVDMCIANDGTFIVIATETCVYKVLMTFIIAHISRGYEDSRRQTQIAKVHEIIRSVHLCP